MAQETKRGKEEGRQVRESREGGRGSQRSCSQLEQALFRVTRLCSFTFTMTRPFPERASELTGQKKRHTCSTINHGLDYNKYLVFWAWNKSRVWGLEVFDKVARILELEARVYDFQLCCPLALLRTIHPSSLGCD